MIYASDFRKGRTFQINGEPHVVLDFLHVKPGKGAAFVRTKYKNIITGATREEAFNPDDKFEEAIIETKKMQYLYDMDGLYYFMDPETYDQIPLGAEQVEDAIKFMRPNDEATVKFFQGNAFLVDETAPTSSFRLNYSTPSDELIVKGIEILGKMTKEILGA